MPEKSMSNEEKEVASVREAMEATIERFELFNRVMLDGVSLQAVVWAKGGSFVVDEEVSSRERLDAACGFALNNERRFADFMEKPEPVQGYGKLAKLGFYEDMVSRVGEVLSVVGYADDCTEVVVEMLEGLPYMWPVIGVREETLAKHAGGLEFGESGLSGGIGSGEEAA